MAVYRQYRMTPKSGRAADLEKALQVLAGRIRLLQGCEGIDLLRETGDDPRFVFTERWLSLDDQKRGGALLGAAAFAPLAELLDAKPESAFLAEVDLNLPQGV
jgi:quinol monooxygenase YgiN